MDFRMRHSHGRNFCLILFNFWYNVSKGNSVFTIKNQQNRSVTFGFTKNRAYDFSLFSPKNCRQIKTVRYWQVRCRFWLIRTCWTQIWHHFFDWRSNSRFSQKKTRKREVTVYIKMTDYVDIALSDLVLIMWSLW